MTSKLIGLLLASSVVSTSAFAGDVANGQEKYEETCIACHGPDGKGTLPGVPNFASKKGPLAQSDDVLFSSIKNGLERPGADLAMPEMGGNPDLTDADMHDIIAYMRKAFNAG